MKFYLPTLFIPVPLERLRSKVQLQRFVVRARNVALHGFWQMFPLAQPLGFALLVVFAMTLQIVVGHGWMGMKTGAIAP